MVVNAFFRNADAGTLHKNSERFCAAFHPPGGLAAADALCYDKATPRRKRSSLRAHGQESPGMVEPGRMDEDEWTFEGEPNRR